MEPLIINSTEDTPKVILDVRNNQFEISGRSIPEDVIGFYKPITNWIDSLIQNHPASIDLDVKLEYFNTASSKIILDILMKLEKMKEDNLFDVKINWHYCDSEDDMKEAGEEYAELVSLEFNFLPY